MSDIRKTLLRKIDHPGEFTVDEIQRELGVSRQAIHKHVKKLTESGEIQKIGSTRGVKYIRNKSKPDVTHHIRRMCELKGMNEDEVLENIQLILNLNSQINTNARGIFAYTFTELLNNAIDHSNSGKVLLEIKLKTHDLEFRIRDYGIGIYANLKEKLNLPSQEVSLQELIKGKATTAPDRHSGEGLFFTSRIADNLAISSHRLSLIFENKQKDILTRSIRFLKGTDVLFSISRNTKKKLADVFDHYSGKEFDYQFSKTSVRVNLFSDDRYRFVSRSIAKRLLHRLDQFDEINIDFMGVTLIGQGFADEIFRVFRNKHPHILLKAINTCEGVRAMIGHVTSNHQKGGW